MPDAPSQYRGRFAPSPTGPLHFGSLVAAVASYLQARSHHGLWFVRIEDLDPPRAVPGAADGILCTLAAFGLQWDGEVIYQSRRGELYADALAQLERAGALYECACTRKEMADSSLRGIEGAVYPGTCRNGAGASRSVRALRVRTDSTMLTVVDRWQGAISRQLENAYGDFVVRRADGLVAYQLACAVDDAEQGITEVVRGADLIESTLRQVHLLRLLQRPPPRYAHHPVVCNAQGEKLSKQTFAPAVDAARAVPLLSQALSFLKQQPPQELQDGDLEGVWRWAIAHWKPQALASGKRDCARQIQ